MSSTNKVLLTLVALGCGLVPIFVDVSDTHLFNENWSSHARTHLAWLLSTNFFVCLIVLYLLWIKNAILVPVALVSAILGGYFVSVITGGLYGGTISEPGGVAEQFLGIEAGIFFFSSLLLVLIVVLFNVSRSNTPQVSSGAPE